MHRLLIVDDEEIIVNGLYEIFSGLAELDLDVYKAYSGEEAIEWLHRTRIDIVITDINMPGIDGLELLGEIRKRWPGCRVIFLTGHNSFEYVYRAIQYGGVSYILKMEDHEKVIEAVKEALLDIGREVRTEDLIHQAKEQINTAQSMFQNDYLLQLLHGRGSPLDERLQFEQLSMPMNPQWPVLLMVGQIDDMSGCPMYYDQIQRLYSIRLILGKYINPQLRSVIIIDEKRRIVLFTQPRESLAADAFTGAGQDVYNSALTFLSGTLEAIQTVCRESLGCPVSFVIGAEPCLWSMVSGKYYELIEMLDYKSETGIEMLTTDADFRRTDPADEPDTMLLKTDEAEQPLRELLRRDGLDSIRLYLDSGQRESCLELINSLRAPLSAIQSKNSNLAIEVYTKAALSLLGYINRWELTEKLAFFIGQNRLMRFDAFANWSEAVAYLTELTEILFSMRNIERQKRTDNAVYALMEYIESHLDEDLSLVRLAERAYMNPSYLSRLFKQIAGINLSEFIEGARIKRAKELLIADSVRIHEVAAGVGYETAASFTRFFRKSTGMSPQEFRNAWLAGKQMTTE